MSTRAIALVLILTTSAFAGCTGGDPDAGGTDELDMSMIMDFLNNSTVDLGGISYYYNNTTIVYQNQSTSFSHTGNGSSFVRYVTMIGSSPGNSVINLTSHNDYILLVREASIPEGSSGMMGGLANANICVEIGSSTESALLGWFSWNNVAYTAVSITDYTQAEENLQDGSCDALAGLEYDIYEIESNLDSSSYWTFGPFGTGIDSIDLWTELQFSMTQNEGERIDLISAGARVSLIGTCVRNCSDGGISDSIYRNYTIGLNANGWNFHQAGGVFFEETSESIRSICSNNMSADIRIPASAIVPGISCVFEFDFSVDNYQSFNTYNDWNDHYEMEWSDWNYFVHYSIIPVNLES